MNSICDLFRVLWNQFIRLKNKGAFHIIAGNFLTKFVAFFGSIFLVRVIAKDDYGILSYYENFMGYFTIITGLGLAYGIIRYAVIADGIALKKACVRHALKRGTVWNMLLIVVALTACLLYPHPKVFSGYYLVPVCIALCIPFAFCLNVAICMFRSMFDYKNYAYFAFASSAMLIIMRVVGAAIGGINMTVMFKLLTEILCAVFCIAFLQKKYFPLVPNVPLPHSFQKDFDNYSMQIMLTNGLWAVFMLNDIFLLGQLCGSNMLIADYKIASVIPANLAIFVSAIGTFVSPYFTKNEHEGNYMWVRKYFLITVGTTMAIMAVAASVCYVFSSIIIKLIFGYNYLSAVPIMRILLLSTFFNCGIRSSIANILGDIGLQKINLGTAIVGVSFQVVLDVVLIPRYGAVGAALTNMASHVFMSAILLYATWKKVLLRRCNA